MGYFILRLFESGPTLCEDEPVGIAASTEALEDVIAAIHREKKGVEALLGAGLWLGTHENNREICSYV